MASLRQLVFAGVVAATLISCTSGDNGSSGGTSAGETSETSRAPGATDETIKIGVTYVDTSSLVDVGLDYDLGDHVAVYQALADQINAEGGIHGRELELVLAPVNATTTTPGEAQCVELTEDEDVFLVTGFYLNDAVLCPVEAHATAVVGGTMTPQRLERARAPWIAWLPDTDQPRAVVETLAERDELDGRIAVYAATADVEEMEDIVLPALEEAGVDVVETGIMDAPPNDATAVRDSVRLIAERFEAADADTIVLVGASGANWPQAMADDPSYRPQLLFLDISAPRAFATSAATTDTSILEGSLTGGGYGPDQARYEQDDLQECLAVLEDAGIQTPAPDEFAPDDRSNQPYQAAFQACPDMSLLQAWLEAAGEDLDYGALEAAIDGLELTIPGDPTRRTYGPAPAADGDPAVYLFGWDEPTKTFVLEED